MDVHGMTHEEQQRYLLTVNICVETIDGWIGVCDEHEQHWTGWKRAEVEALGRAHQDFWRLPLGEDGDDSLDVVEEDDGGCSIYFAERVGEAV